MEPLDPQHAESLRTILLVVLGTLIFVIPVVGVLVVLKVKADAGKAKRPPENGNPAESAEDATAAAGEDAAPPRE